MDWDEGLVLGHYFGAVDIPMQWRTTAEYNANSMEDAINPNKGAWGYRVWITPNPFHIIGIIEE